MGIFLCTKCGVVCKVGLLCLLSMLSQVGTDVCCLRPIRAGSSVYDWEGLGASSTAAGAVAVC
jgi:hypothetical protein